MSVRGIAGGMVMTDGTGAVAGVDVDGVSVELSASEIIMDSLNVATISVRWFL